MIHLRDDVVKNNYARLKSLTSSLLFVSLLVTTGCFNDDNALTDAKPILDDPSELTGPTFGDLPVGLEEANHGAFEGGLPADISANNVLQASAQRDDGVFNVPTNGAPSPLFGAEPFTQQMLRFEEFGAEPIDLSQKIAPIDWTDLPAAATATSIPNSEALESFLGQDLWPIPTQYANTEKFNPWQGQIEDYLGRTLDTPPAEGRPPGLGWSHQRWDEFKPKNAFQTATTGSRTNGGFRDSKQGHQYSVGEFAPGGLYHNTTGVA